jgi:hypothetical protein
MKSVLVCLQEYSPRASEVEKGVIKVPLYQHWDLKRDGHIFWQGLYWQLI